MEKCGHSIHAVARRAFLCFKQPRPTPFRSNRRNMRKLLTSPFYLFAVLGILIAGATTSRAQNVGTNNTNGLLVVEANVQSAIYVDVSAAPGGLETSVYDPQGDGSAFNFGNLNGLGIYDPAPGITKTVQANGTLYTTPYRITPRFSGFSSSTASLKIEQSSSNSSEDMGVLREGASAAGVSTVPVVGAGTNFTTTAANGIAITRYLGMFVGNGNGSLDVASVAGSRRPEVYITITVE